MAEIEPKITKSYRTKTPLLDIKMISHGTLSVVNIQESRRFYEEVLGLEVIQHAPVGLMIRLGSAHSYVVIEDGQKSPMRLVDHNGLDVRTNDAVNDAYQKLLSVKAEYGLGRIAKPQDQHGAYSFYFQDMDGNWWEILAEAGGPDSNDGYSIAFNDPNRDMTGADDIDPELMEHVLDNEFVAELTAKRTQSGKS